MYPVAVRMILHDRGDCLIGGLYIMILLSLRREKKTQNKTKKRKKKTKQTNPKQVLFCNAEVQHENLLSGFGSLDSCMMTLEGKK